ncbi:MAG: ABC transporter permease [Gemmatimonadota bacterium]|jgi:peptide/nickel transport system permease protein
MLRYAIRRLLFSIPVLLLSSILVFTVVHATADPLAMMRSNPRVSQEDVMRVRQQLGLDRSGPAQYVSWLSHFVRGDWGTSLITGASVGSEIRSALVNSAVLGIAGIVVSLLFGVTIGVLSALRQYSTFDNVATGGAFLGLSIPNFWFALMLQIVFGLYLTRWFNLSEPIVFTAGMTSPGSTGFHPVDLLRHLALPALVLSVQIVAIYSRYTRASMLEVLHADYLRTARAKGLKERRVIFHHALRNALIPLTTQLGIDVGAMAAGLIITEQIFQWPGMGRFFITAMNNGDYPQILPWLMITVTFVIVFNLLADITYAILDPRIRYA